MSEWLFWRTADTAVAQVGKKPSGPSQPTLNKHARDAEESATSNQSRGIEEVEVGIGSDDGFVCGHAF